jgi:hypothetical protein
MIGGVGASVACMFAAVLILRQLVGLFWVCIYSR